MAQEKPASAVAAAHDQPAADTVVAAKPPQTAAKKKPRTAVRLLTARAGSEFSQAPGEVIKVSADEARRMIDGQLAEPVQTAAGRKPPRDK